MTQRIWTMDGPSMGYGVMSGGSFAWLYWVAVGLGLVVWIVLARSSLVHGGDMERSDRVPQLYGYDARREMTQSILMLVIAAVLFAWHWRWVRRERLA